MHVYIAINKWQRYLQSSKVRALKGFYGENIPALQREDGGGQPIHQPPEERPAQPLVCIQLDAVAHRCQQQPETKEAPRLAPSAASSAVWLAPLLTGNFIQRCHTEDTSSRFKSMWRFLWQSDDVSVTQNKCWPTGVAYIYIFLWIWVDLLLF